MHPGTEPLLDVVITSVWQKLIFVHKMGLCLDSSFVELKNYALKSGN